METTTSLSVSSDLPSISIIIPTLNSEKTIAKCLNSISAQDYPRGKIEMIVIDGGSSDSTIKQIKSFNVTIIIDEDKKDNQEARKAVGLLNAKSDIVGFIDSDNILPHPRWLSRMVEPFCQNKEVVATQPLRYTYDKSASLLNRYFALFGVNDPIPYYFNKRDRLSWAEDSWTLLGKAKDMGTYFLVRFAPEAIPTLGANGFLARRKILLKTKCSPSEFLHIDINCDLIALGYDTYGIVKEDIIHLSGDGFLSFLRKRFFYMKRYYLNNKSMRRFTMYSPHDRGRLIKYITFSITLLEPLLHSIRGYRKIRDKAWFLHPVMCLSILFVYGFAVIEKRLKLLIGKH